MLLQRKLGLNKLLISSSGLQLLPHAGTTCSLLSLLHKNSCYATDTATTDDVPTTVTSHISSQKEPKTKSKAAKLLLTLPPDLTKAISEVQTALCLQPTKVAHIITIWQQIQKKDPDACSVNAHALQDMISHLQSTYSFNLEDLEQFFSRHPEVLRCTVPDHVEPVSAALRSLLSTSDEQIKEILVKRADVLLNSPSDLSGKINYLLGIGIKKEDLNTAVTLHPTILTSTQDAIMTNIAFLLGSAFKLEEIVGMLSTSPKWLTMGLTELTVKWQFFRQEMKGRQVDLMLWPQILERDLLQTLGPRTGFARKKRLKMLMPSYCWGHPLLESKTTWREGMVVPVLWYMSVSPSAFCKVLNFSHEDFVRYKRCWLLTTGQTWRKQLYGYALPNNDAYNLFRAGLGAPE